MSTVMKKTVSEKVVAADKKSVLKNADVTAKSVDLPVKVIEVPVKVSEAPVKSTSDSPKSKPAKKSVKTVEPSASSTTSTTTVTTAPSSTTAVEEVVAPAAETTIDPSMNEDVFGPRFAALLDRLSSFSNEFREVTTLVRSLQKDHARFLRENTKRNAKRQRTAKRTASGFAKPTLLSDEMYSFLSIEKGTLVVRNDVTRKLNEYVVSNNLRDEADKRRIIPNATLRTLLNVPEGDSLTYFNIQKYIKHHFIKPVVA